MTNTNKTPVWITIPDKMDPNKAPSSQKGSVDPDKVNNKFFWGAGFAALAVFSFMLILPGKFSELFQGDLFDGDFKVVPTASDLQQEGSFFGGAASTTDKEAAPEKEVKSNAVLTPTPTNSTSEESETDAVPFQIDPVQPSSENFPQETPEDQSVLPELDSEPVVDTSANELKALLETLTAQVEELKQGQLQKDEEIQALNDQLEQQAIHEAAKPQPAEISSGAQQPSTTLGTQVTPEETADKGVYQFNTHTVTLNPRGVLAGKQNVNPQMQQQDLKPITTQDMNASLSGVNNQPTTGPMESLMIAFLISTFAVLGYGIYRSMGKA